MTLIVGIPCSDGVVIGTDSAVTAGPIVLPGMSKVHSVADCALVACAGSVGPGQRFLSVVSERYRTDQALDTDGTLVEEGNELAAKAFRNFQSTGWIRGECSSVVALGLDHGVGDWGLLRFHFGSEPGPTTVEVIQDIPFIALGSGRDAAMPLLAFVRKVFWSGSQPSVVDAIFAIAFVMETAIEIAASGVGGKLQVGVLGPEEDEEVAHSSDRGCEANRRYSARLLEPNEVEEQRAAALGAYEHLAAYRRGGSAAVSEPEQIPALEWD